MDNIDKAGQVIFHSSDDADGSPTHIYLTCETEGLLFYPDGLQIEYKSADFEVFQFEGKCASQSKVRSPHAQD